MVTEIPTFIAQISHKQCQIYMFKRCLTVNLIVTYIWLPILGKGANIKTQYEDTIRFIPTLMLQDFLFHHIIAFMNAYMD